MDSEISFKMNHNDSISKVIMIIMIIIMVIMIIPSTHT